MPFARLRRRQRTGLPTFLFVDMADFTSTTERIGDEAAAELARRFRREMCALSCRMDTRQIKSMGDGVMIWAHDPGAAVALAQRIVREIGTNPELLPVRVGVHTGPAIRRGRDWYGSAVNVAARLAAQAQPNEALISAATTGAAADRKTPALTDCRALTLRGVGRPVDAWRLT